MHNRDTSEIVRTVMILTLADPGYSRSAVIAKYYPNELRHFSNTQDFRSTCKQFFTQGNSPDVVVVLSPSHQLVLSVRTFFKGPILLDAGWPLSDSSDDESKNFISNKVRNLKSLIIDFFAFHLSTQVVFESTMQARYSKRKFLLSKRKISVRYTGFDESRAKSVGMDAHSKSSLRASEQKHLVFRGKYNAESGLDLLAEVSKKLPKWIQLTVLCPNLPQRLEFAPNVRIIKDYLNENHLYKIMSDADLIVGQLGSKKRLTRTIPHKFFESAFLGVPYLTQKTEAFLEVVGDNDVIYVESKIPDELAEQIVQELNNPDRLNQVSRNIQEIYNVKFESNQLIKQFTRIINQLLKRKD